MVHKLWASLKHKAFHPEIQIMFYSVEIMEYEDNGEEMKLVRILSYRDSEIQLAAFRRLVRIYRSRIENDAVYGFLETLDTYNIERSSFLLEYFFEFIVDEHINHKRVEKVVKNKKIMKSLMDMVEIPSLQCNSLLILNILLSSHDCTAVWLERIIEILYYSTCEMVERLCAKIIITTIKKDVWPDKQSIERLKSKIENSQQSIVRLRNALKTNEQPGSVNGSISDMDDNLGLLKETLLNSRPFSVMDYFESMRTQNMAEIYKSVDRYFFKKKLPDIEEKIEEVIKLYEDLLSSGNDQTVQCVLEHIRFLLEVLPPLRLKQTNMENLKEQLIELTEVSDEEIRYLSTNVVSFLMMLK